jgi:hypothetical protein
MMANGASSSPAITLRQNNNYLILFAFLLQHRKPSRRRDSNPVHPV